MKKLAILLGLMMGLSSAWVLAEGQQQVPAPAADPVAWNKAKETCTKKGLAGSLLDECIKKEIQPKTQSATATPATPQTTPSNPSN